MKLEDEKITRRYSFVKALTKFINKYREKGVGIESVEIKWEDEKKLKGGKIK